jgi:Tol biopolymer transport system component
LGRYVAFASDASNLDRGDTNGQVDVFVRDVWEGRTRRVSLSTSGVQANYLTGWGTVAVSGDGGRVVFDSGATNLVPGDSNGAFDIFVHDVRTSRTERVSVGPGGRQGNFESPLASISADGRYVAFQSVADNLVEGDTNGVGDVFVRDLKRGVTRRVSLSSTGAQGDGFSGLGNINQIAISADGRFVVFLSQASNLVPGDTNEEPDVFVRDVRRGITRRVSVSSTGQEANGLTLAPSISATGRFVVFVSAANLTSEGTNGFVQVYIRDRRKGTTRLVSAGTASELSEAGAVTPQVSMDGARVSFGSSSTNLVTGKRTNNADIFVRRLPH